MTLIQMRRGDAATWTSVNPTLAAGELGLELGPGVPPKLKAGDGTTSWTGLDYLDTELIAALEEKADLAGAVSISGNYTFINSPVIPDATATNHSITKNQFDAKVLDSFDVLLASDVTWGGSGTTLQDVSGFSLSLGSSAKNRWLSFEGKIFTLADGVGDYKGSLAFTGAGVTYKIFSYSLPVGATINVSSFRVDMMTNTVPGTFIGAGLTPDEVPFKLEGEIYVPASITASIQMRHSPANTSGTSCKTMTMSTMHAVTWRETTP